MIEVSLLLMLIVLVSYLGGRIIGSLEKIQSSHERIITLIETLHLPNGERAVAFFRESNRRVGVYQQESFRCSQACARKINEIWKLEQAIRRRNQALKEHGIEFRSTVKNASGEYDKYVEEEQVR